MGIATFTPQFSDYGANTWASNPNQAATKAVIANICDILSRGLFIPNGADCTMTIDFGNNAVGPSGTDPGGAASFPNLGNTHAYSALRSAYQNTSNKNSIQTLAWADTNIPAVDPINDGPYQQTTALQYALGLSAAPANPVAYVGVTSASYPDLDINGLGAGVNYFEAIFHEVTECLGRRLPEEFWWYDGVGSHQIIKANARYMSYDGGTLASKIYQMTTTGSDAWDTDGSVQTAYSASVLTGAVSRTSVLPGFANDWLTLTVVGWGLTTTGLGWAGLTTPATGPVGLIGLRR